MAEFRMVLDLGAALHGLPGFPQLAGARVRLRAPRDEDTDALFGLFSDPAVMRYWSRAPMTEPSEAAGLIVEIGEAFEQREKLGWIITGRDADAAIGTCTLFHFARRHRRAEIGYALRGDHWGRGIATEAVSLALDWAFRTLGLHRVEADIDPHNLRSRNLLLRLGFAAEGVLRERFFVEDQATDSEIFGLLADDWKKNVARRSAPGRDWQSTAEELLL